MGNVAFSGTRGASKKSRTLVEEATSLPGVMCSIDTAAGFVDRILVMFGSNVPKVRPPSVDAFMHTYLFVSSAELGYGRGGNAVGSQPSPAHRLHSAKASTVPAPSPDELFSQMAEGILMQGKKSPAAVRVEWWQMIVDGGGDGVDVATLATKK